MAGTTPSSSVQVRGIDVSHYQGTVNWPQVAGAGVAFAFVKATEGITTVDPMFNQNWSGVRAAGLLRGAYHFYEPGDDPVQQAEHFLTVVSLSQGDLPPVLDIETSGSSTPATIVQGIQTWLETVQQGTGRTPIVYTGNSFWKTLGTSAFGAYPLWIAEYGVQTPVLPSGWSRWTFWQYSETGAIAGVSGQVDLDFFQGSLQNLKKLAAGSLKSK
jgi:lysozyme